MTRIVLTTVILLAFGAVLNSTFAAEYPCASDPGGCYIDVGNGRQAHRGIPVG